MSIYILTAFNFVIICVACIFIIYAGFALMKEGEDINNRNLRKAGKRLSVAGNLLFVIVLFSPRHSLDYIITLF